MIHRFYGLLRVGRIKLVDDTGPIQRVQIDEGDLAAYGARRVIDKVAHILQFGFASSPPIDSEAMLAALGGDRTQTIALGTNHQPSRIKGLQPGDSCLYDVRGMVVKMTADGLLIDCAGLPAVIQNFSALTVVGDIQVTGDVISRSAGAPVSLNALRDDYNAHTHSVSAVGSPTGATNKPA